MIPGAVEAYIQGNKDPPQTTEKGDRDEYGKKEEKPV